MDKARIQELIDGLHSAYRELSLHLTDQEPVAGDTLSLLQKLGIRVTEINGYLYAKVLLEGGDSVAGTNRTVGRTENLHG